MKTVLAVIGGLMIVGVLVVAGGGYFMYKKGMSTASVEMGKAVKKFIDETHPTEEVTASLYRVTNAMKLRTSMWSVGIGATALKAIEDKKVTPEELSALDDAGRILEAGEPTKEQLKDFFDKHKDLAPERARPH
jgi:hypothetical protein